MRATSEDEGKNTKTEAIMAKMHLLVTFLKTDS